MMERTVSRMKVIKRDGRVVEYDRNKILTAIKKANAEVERDDKLKTTRLKVLWEV